MSLYLQNARGVKQPYGNLTLGFIVVLRKLTFYFFYSPQLIWIGLMGG